MTEKLSNEQQEIIKQICAGAINSVMTGDDPIGSVSGEISERLSSLCDEDQNDLTNEIVWQASSTVGEFIIEHQEALTDTAFGAIDFEPET